MDTDDEKQSRSRRSFIRASAAAFLGSSIATACGDQPGKLPEPNEAQRSHKRTGRSRVYLAQVDGYEPAKISAAIETGCNQLGTSFKDKSVFLKINLVDYREGLPVATHPLVLDAIINYLKKNGAAKIKVGDAPALSRDTEEIARLVGITAVCKQQEVEFIDLNIDDLQVVDNPLRFTEIKEFLLPKSIMTADSLVSVPKLKTHHWALMTSSMKNMFGVVPGRKYGWPKNILHIKGINQSVVDIVAAAKPDFAIVDGIIAMEGDGPLAGTAKDLEAIILGDDLTAVDTVCGHLMEIPVHNVPYLKLAGKVLGNNDLPLIDVLGATIDSIKKKFVLPPTFEANGMPKNLSKLEKTAEQSVT